MTRMVRMVAVALFILLSRRCPAAEHNEPLGGAANEERLKRVIHETIKPKPVEHEPVSADVQALLAWSKPVNGLVARIESVWADNVFLVRLKNLSDSPLSVPTGNPVDAKAARLSEVFVKQGSSPWREITRESRFNNYVSAPDQMVEARPAAIRRRRIPARSFPSDRPWITLQPGEDCIAVASGFDGEGTGEPKQLKISLKQPDSGVPGRWSGVLETPPRPLELHRKQHRALRGAVPFPDHYPEFSYQYGGVVFAEPKQASGVHLLEDSNLPLIHTLAIYEPAAVSREFERRMRAEKIFPMQLVFAGIAAPAGSEAAALFFLETMKSTDFSTANNLSDALSFMSQEYGAYPPTGQKREPPVWLAEIILAFSSDNRFVTGLKRSGWAEGTSFTIASEFGMVSTLVEWKYRNVVPLLNERVKSGTADWRTWSDLAQFGDPRAIPALIASFKATAKKGLTEEERQDEGFIRCSYALSRLKAREAVPILLAYIEYPEIVNVLAEIGDPRALPALHNLIAAKGHVLRDGKRVAPEQEPERLFAAKLAIARFEPQNEAQRLDEMLADSVMQHRYDSVMRLGQLTDPRVIPILVKVIKTDSNHFILQMAIRDLGERRDKAAVDGLIDCFDVAFKEEDVGKGGHVSPATYRNLIARNLQELTGQQFGAYKQRWLQWWQEQGRLSTDLK